METPNPLAQGPPVWPPPGPALAPQHTACAALGAGACGLWAARGQANGATRGGTSRSHGDTAAHHAGLSKAIHPKATAQCSMSPHTGEFVLWAPGRCRDSSSLHPHMCGVRGSPRSSMPQEGSEESCIPRRWLPALGLLLHPHRSECDCPLRARWHPTAAGFPRPLHGFTPANPRCSCRGAKLGYAEESAAGQKVRGSSGALLAWGAKTSPHTPPASSQGMLARPQAPLAASTATLRGWHPAVPCQGAVTGTTRRTNPLCAPCAGQDASPRQAGLAPGPPAPPAAAAWPSTAHAAHRSRGGPWPRASRCRQVTVFPGRHPRRGPARVPWPPPAGAGPPGPAPTAPPRPPGPSSTAGRDGGPRRLRASGQAVTQRLGAHAAGLPLLQPRPGGGISGEAALPAPSGGGGAPGAAVPAPAGRSCPGSR